ncbi:MAG: hypothetical protein QG577_403 [Thermodesulfobacteriota bacterium]|nr:hypothetical protein [Thermodesulfobacteriota bacterium]
MDIQPFMQIYLSGEETYESGAAFVVAANLKNRGVG